MPKRVLAVASVRVDPAVFRANLKSLRAQRLPKGVELDLRYIIDDEEHEVELADLIDEFGGTFDLAEKRPTEALYGVGPKTHAWNAVAFEHLAQTKQKLLDYAAAEAYDYAWVVDTDLILDPSTLASALALNEDIVSSVFWTPWQAGSTALPQVWLAHPYVLQGKGMSQEEFLDKLQRRKVLPVAGGGACTLISAEALKKVRYHPRLVDLPMDGMWQGEDRTFSILAERGHLTHVADGWPDIAHLYHGADRSPEAIAAAETALLGPRQLFAKYGDLVNFTLESLDDPQVVGRTFPVRGRLGGLWLSPEIEAALQDMQAGSQRFVEISYPQSWPIEPLRGQRRILAVNLVDVKPYGFAPGVAEEIFKGVGA